MAAMVADLDAFSVFSGRKPLKADEVAHFAVVHADPAAPELPGLISDMSAKIATGYLVGGVSSSRSRTVQIANEVLSGGLSGAVLGERARVATRLTQGCTPFPGRYRVTECEDNIIARAGRPAGARGAARGGGRRALAAPGRAAGARAATPATTRRATWSASTRKHGLIAIGDTVEPGMEVLFCKRDAAAARKDLERVLRELHEAIPQPRGALYYSCVARGEHMFGRRGAELELVRRALGDVPLVGFFCNGEISRDRLYGYTGVLTVFN